MISIKHGKVLLSSTPVIPGDLVLNIQFAGDAASASTSFTDLPFDKQRVFCFDFDDNSVSAWWNKDYMASKTFTDGCGNNISYAAAIGVNIIATVLRDELPALPTNDAHARGSITYAEMATLISMGYDMANHTGDHTEGVPEEGDTEETITVAENIEIVTQKLMQNLSYKDNMLIVPSSYPNYMETAMILGLLGATSQGTFDERFRWDNVYWNAIAPGVTKDWPKRLSTFDEFYNANNGFIPLPRDFNVTGWHTTNNEAQTVLDLMTGYASKSYGAGAMHTMDDGQPTGSETTNFRQFIDNIGTQLGDTVAVIPQRRFAEYMKLQRQVVKTEQIQGNTLRIGLDYSSVTHLDRMSWREHSFIVGGTQEITSVACNDPNRIISFNPETRLVNILYRKTTWSN